MNLTFSTKLGAQLNLYILLIRKSHKMIITKENKSKANTLIMIKNEHGQKLGQIRQNKNKKSIKNKLRIEEHYPKIVR